MPQGPGIVNLSLAWPVYHSLGEAAEPIYLFLCGLLQRTLATFGVASHCRAVSGSFCDGRYNLACGEGEEVRKIAGTAQYWRPMAEGRGHVVLAHAVVLLDADLAAAHRAANDFEARLGSGREYRADKTVTWRSWFQKAPICCPAFARRWRSSWKISAEGRLQIAAKRLYRPRYARRIGANDVQTFRKRIHRPPSRQQLLNQPAANRLPGAKIRQ